MNSETPLSRYILALNSGSSSLKFGLYRAGPARLETLLAQTIDSADHQSAIEQVGRRLSEANLPAPDAIGHRVVHGGPHLFAHTPIDAQIVQQLRAAASFAPLHTPAVLAVIQFAQTHFPGTPQVACLDTAFHAGMPAIARTLPIALELQSQGIRRYGFHGLSLESILQQLEQRGAGVPQRLIVAHMGNGASVTAILGGKSVDTSMGLTPSGGAIMGTRSGDLDPGVLIHLLRDQSWSAARLEDLVDHRSGLAGISGVSSDMRRLHASAASNPQARLAIDMFCASMRKQIAAMISVLDGVDMLVFTGGIGENDGEVRTSICAGLKWIGIELDPSSKGATSTAASRCLVMVLPSQEDEQIARHTYDLLFRQVA